MKRHNYDVGDVVRLVIRSLFRELSEEEQKEYSRMMQDKNLLNNGELLRDGKALSEKLQASPKFDTQGAYHTFLSRRRRAGKVRMMQVVRVAASLLIPLMVGLYLFYAGGDEQVQEAEVQSIEPVSSMAYIVLADGRKVDLSVTGDTLSEKDGTRIENDTKQVVYDKNPYDVSGLLIYNELNVPRGGEYTLVLGDGTKVWINSDTKLKFPVQFNGKTREVYLSGEAYFEVTPNTEKPFVVHTSLGSVNVLGTAFNVRDYQDEQQVVTTLASGSVQYQDKKNPARVAILKPGFQLTDTPEGGVLAIKKVNLKEFIGWKDGLYIFNNLTLEQMMKTVERNYDVTVFFASEEVKNLLFSGDLQKYERIENFLKFIEIGGDVSFVVKDRTITVNKK